MQEAWLRLERADVDAIENLDGWLTTVVARLALDRLRSARARRETYVGPWIPEPLVSDDPADRVTLDESVSYALLTVREQLSPVERTAFVLHDVFDVPFGAVADVVGRTPEAVRQLASRARRHVNRERPRFAAVLDPDVVWTSDGRAAAGPFTPRSRSSSTAGSGWCSRAPTATRCATRRSCGGSERQDACRHPCRPDRGSGTLGRVGPSSSAVDKPEWAEGGQRLAVLLAMAMFVLVVDTSLMNVSIAKVVEDLGTTVSSVQGAIALEALVSAAFILVGSKTGDLIGRKRAFVLGLLGYALGALAMTLAQSVTAIIVFWAIVGGLGASLLLPAMQSLIHGNFHGADQKRAYALVGAAAAIAAAVGPLLGGFLTTLLSWRVGFLLEVVVIAIVLSNIKLVQDVPYTGDRSVDVVGALLSALGMGGLVVGILVWQEGGEFVGLLIAVGLVALGSLARWLVRRKRAGKPTLLDPDLFKLDLFRLGISSQLLQNVALGGMMIALPIYLQMVLEYNALQTGLTLAPLSLTMFATAVLAGKRAGRRRPAAIIRAGAGLLTVGVLLLLPIVPRAHSGWALVIPLIIAGAGLGLLVSQLNNYTLSPISDERVSEAAGVNSAAGSFGLSFGLAFAGAIMLATLSIAFTQKAEDSKVLPPAAQEQVADALEHDAEVMSNTALEKQLAGQPQEIQDEIIRINTDARPLALQVALSIPILAGLLGLLNGFRMMRRPDPAPSGAAEMALA